MTLKLPEPLPYDVVDEWLDKRYTFSVEEWTPYRLNKKDDPEIVLEYPRAESKVPLPDYSVVKQPMYMLKSDDYYRSLEEDDEGYVFMPYQTGWSWTTREWTDEEIDAYLELNVIEVYEEED